MDDQGLDRMNGNVTPPSNAMRYAIVTVLLLSGCASDSPQGAGYFDRPRLGTEAPMVTAPARSVDEIGRTTSNVMASEPRPPAKLGKFTVEVEKLAKSEQCSNAPVVALTGSGPGFENYSVRCSNGDALVVRCDLGNCRALK